MYSFYTLGRCRRGAREEVRDKGSMVLLGILLFLGRCSAFLLSLGIPLSLRMSLILSWAGGGADDVGSLILSWAGGGADDVGVVGGCRHVICRL